MSKQINGRYELVSHGIFSQSGDYKPTSEYCRGELYYGVDGFLSLLILFSKNPTQAKDVFGYLGNYSMKSDTAIEHQITVASHPKLVDTTEERVFTFDGSRLTLGRDFDDGTRFEAVWRKLT